MWRDAASLYDIVESGRLVLTYVDALTSEVFEADTLRQDAVIRRLVIMGEASKRVSLDFRTAHPEVPWREMAGFRDIAVHDYLAIVIARVWMAATTKVASIVELVEALVDDAGDKA